MTLRNFNALVEAMVEDLAVRANASEPSEPDVQQDGPVRRTRLL